MEKKQSYKLLNVALMESNFSRKGVIDFSKLQTSTSIGKQSSIGKQCIVVVSLKFEATVDEEVQVQASIKMVGEFKVPENPVMPVEEFLNTNAAALIFPFLREHLASLTLKAGMQPYFVETVNFLEFENSNQEK